MGLCTTQVDCNWASSVRLISDSELEFDLIFEKGSKFDLVMGIIPDPSVPDPIPAPNGLGIQGYFRVRGGELGNFFQKIGDRGRILVDPRPGLPASHPPFHIPKVPWLMLLKGWDLGDLNPRPWLCLHIPYRCSSNGSGRQLLKLNYQLDVY